MEAATTIPEAIFVEIIGRPLRSIARFKSVCKQLKALIESPYLRRVFASLHKRSSSSSWSLMFGSDHPYPITEAIGFHGCDTWDLPRSLVSYIIPFQLYPNLPTLRYFYISSSNELIWIDVFPNRTVGIKTFVGNPVLQQWVEIPPPPEYCKSTALVMRLDEDGAF